MVIAFPQTQSNSVFGDSAFYSFTLPNKFSISYGMDQKLSNKLEQVKNHFCRFLDGKITEKQMKEAMAKNKVPEEILVTWLNGHSNGVVRGMLEVCKRLGIKADVEELTQFGGVTMGKMEETPPEIN